MKHVRNVVILAAIAGAIVALPGGGAAADIVYALLSLAFYSLLAYFGARMYREHRLDLASLGDRLRAILYAAIAVAAVTLAASSRLASTGAGTLALIALLAACVWALAFVYRSYRQY